MGMTNNIKEFEWNDEKYSITRFSGDKGLEVSLNLMKLFAPIMASMASMANEEANKTVLGDLGRVIGTSLNVPEIKQLVKDLFSVVLFNGKPINLDLHLPGRYALIIPLCKEVIEHNGFLEIIGGFKDMIPPVIE
jgi:hypothetical protein